jgi:hypothetical protein
MCGRREGHSIMSMVTLIASYRNGPSPADQIANNRISGSIQSYSWKVSLIRLLVMAVYIQLFW